MKVVVVSHDLSHNCLGRAHVLADLLRQRADVEIVGPAAAGDIWGPLRHETAVPIRAMPRRMSAAELDSRLAADVIYAVKARAGSLGLALAARRRTGVPVIADVDDWEMSFFLDDPAWMVRNMLDVRKPDNFWATWQAGRTVRKADAVTVSSGWLQNRYGGHLIPHARNSRTFLDRRHSSDLRDALGLRDRKVVLFLGSPRPHKGLHLVVAALDLLADPRVVFLVVGGAHGLPARPWIRSMPQQPYHRVPEFLALADVVALAQLPSRTAAAQVPAKVFDAMAMARPVVASRVSDLPAILDGCGIIVDPGDAPGLAAAIGSLLDDPGLARRIGQAARARFEAEYSYDAVRPRLERLIEDVARSRP